MRVLFVSSEIYPYAKTGGLADVSSALPKALRESGVEVVSMMPLYGSLDREKFGLVKSPITFDVLLNGHRYPCEVFNDGEIYFIANAALFGRESLYGEYEDNGIRFGVFAYAVMELALRLHLSWDAIHLNDWQSALVAYLVKVRYKVDAKVVLTIHNLAFQGVFPKTLMDDLEIGWDAFTMHRFEFYDQVNLLKGAIAYSDSIVAASERYAAEIQTPEYGCDLDPFLRSNGYKLRGILNGIDGAEFNAAEDSYLYQTYRDPLSQERGENKRKLLYELGLEDPQRPLFVFIGRFAWQKGVGTLLESITYLHELQINVAILGSGERYYNDAFSALGSAYPNVAVRIGYDERLARMMYASGDFLMMPSVYEPCGLNQMIAMAYGSIPIVRSTGGLADSVADLCDEPFPEDRGVGIVFEKLDRFSFLLAIARALALYGTPERFESLIRHNHSVDNSWTSRAQSYLALYTQRGDR